MGWTRRASAPPSREAHYDFFHAGRFIWYNPSFEPDLAKLSPGEVLLKRLLELAREERALEFDLTIGEEALKLRFATRTGEVVDVYLAGSKGTALVRQVSVRARNAGERLLRKERLTTILHRLG